MSDYYLKTLFNGGAFIRKSVTITIANEKNILWGGWKRIKWCFQNWRQIVKEHPRNSCKRWSREGCSRKLPWNYHWCTLLRKRILRSAFRCENQWGLMVKAKHADENRAVNTKSFLSFQSIDQWMSVRSLIRVRQALPRVNLPYRNAKFHVF